MKFRSSILDQCVTVYTVDNRSFRVWKSSMIEEWDERNRVWKYTYDLQDQDKKELLDYAGSYFFDMKEKRSSQYSDQYTDIISDGGMDSRGRK